MKHGSLISPDEGSFGFGAHTSATVETISTHADAAEFITVPDAHLLFSGEFKHSGNDLKIVGDDGKSFVVTDYFKTDKHPTLRSPDGATLNGDLVDLLAGPLAPGQYAQAGAPQPSTAEAVGRVAVVTGNVTIIRNGVTVTVNAGDVILKNDVVQTGAGATCGLSLNDGSTFNLTGGARLAINDFVYDPNGTANSSLTTLIQGAATFVAGQIAKTGDMKVATPVATMGIRGTAVILDINAVDGRVTMSIVDERDGREHLGEVFDRAGNLIATVTSNGGRLTLTPTATLDVIASFTNKTADMIAREFAAFQAVLSSYDAAKQFFPNLPDRAEIVPKGTNHAEGTGIQPSNTTTGLGDPNPLGNQGKTIEYVITKNVETPGTGPDNHSTDPNAPTGPGEPVVLSSGVIKYGTIGNDTIEGTTGNDFIYAGAGDDTIVAGHGEGNDFYDGDGDNGSNPVFAGAGFDKITFHSTNNPITFNLFTIAGQNTADNIDTGHDIFTNIERIESGGGNDIFILHGDANGKTFDGEIDGGAGDQDTILLAGNLSVGEHGEDGPPIQGIEIIDLNTTDANSVQMKGSGAIDAIYGAEGGHPNDSGNLVFNGDGDDHVYLMNEDNAGVWEKGGTANGYTLYTFTADEDDTQALVYIDSDINADIIENVTVNVATPDGYDLGSDQLYADMAGSEVDQYTAEETQFSAYNEAEGLYFVVTGTGLTYDIEGDDHFQITGGFITGIKIYDVSEDLLVEATGFNFDAAQFNTALNTYRDSGFADATGLDAIFENVVYDFTGNNGADHSEGGAFGDKFNGAGGNDEFTGNGGADTFVVHGAGHTTVTDFSISGGDRIDVSGFSQLRSMTQIGPLAHKTGVDAQHPDGTGTVIDFGNGDVLTLPGVILKNLTDDDFLFASGPILDLDANNSSGGTGSGYQTTATLGGAAIAVLDSDASITLADTLQSATIRLVGTGFEFTDYPDITFGIDVSSLSGATGNSFSGSWHGINWQFSGGSSSLLINITGNGPATDYLKILQAARASFDTDISNTGANVTITVNSAGGSASATTAVQFNDAPTVNAAVPSPLVEDSVVTSSTTVSVSDPDSLDHYVLGSGWLAVAPGVAGQQQISANGHYYAFFAFAQGTVSWTDAQNAAHALGGDLATITGAGENSFIFGNIVGDNVENGATAAYIGASDVGSTGSWHWSSGLEGIPYFWNGSSSSYGQYTNWRDGEPNFLGTEHVLVMEGDGTWNNASDAYGNAVGYVVEFANYRMDGTYGYAIFNTANGTITYHLNNGDLDTQALGADSHVTDDFQIAVSDGLATTTKTISFEIDGANDAPVVDSHEASVNYTVGDPGVAIDSDIALSDIDSATLHGATVTIDNFQDGDALIFATLGTITGEYNPETGVLILTGDASIADYQAALRSISYQNIYPSASTEDRTISYQVDDGSANNHASNVATSTIHVDAGGGGEIPNEAPVIHTDRAYTSGDYYSTTLAGLSVTDAETDENSGEQYTVTAAAGYGTLSISGGNSQTEISFHDPLEAVNNKLGNGITYTAGEDDPCTTDDDNDTVTLTVTDANGGSDTVNFRFSVFGETDATLTGNGDKDVLFGTGHNDVLTGNENADTFVFDNHGGFENIGHDTINDFVVGVDKIDLGAGFDSVPTSGTVSSPVIDFNCWVNTPGAFTESDGNTTIHISDNEDIILKSVQIAQLSANDFIIHPGGGA